MFKILLTMSDSRVTLLSARNQKVTLLCLRAIGPSNPLVRGHKVGLARHLFRQDLLVGHHLLFKVTQRRLVSLLVGFLHVRLVGDHVEHA